eukprot:765380-Hanusia_phi.AAC.2
MSQEDKIYFDEAMTQTGVGTFYTDPQIHSLDGKSFGSLVSVEEAVVTGFQGSATSGEKASSVSSTVISATTSAGSLAYSALLAAWKTSQTLLVALPCSSQSPALVC